jgi:hypothetical protein
VSCDRRAIRRVFETGPGGDVKTSKDLQVMPILLAFCQPGPSLDDELCESCLQVPFPPFAYPICRPLRRSSSDVRKT